MDTFEPPKYLTSLIAAVNDGAKVAQTGAFAFALVGLYLLATAFSATDEDLLLDRTLAISQLSAQIPVTVSFAMMPILFVALHVFTLIRYDMLAANVHQFRVDLDVMVPLAVDRERCRQLLANVEFIQSLTAPPGSALRSRLFGFVAWVVIAAFPVIVLLAVQTNALRYQSEVVINVQRASLLIDLAVLFWFYNRQWRWRTTAPPDALCVTVRRWGICLSLPLTVIAADLTWLNVPGPDDIEVGQHVPRFLPWTLNDARYALHQPVDLFLCPRFNWGCRFLRVDHRTLVGKVWDSKAIVELGAGQPLTEARLASFERVFLRERILRFAKLDETRLYAADLRGADLTRAEANGANLTRANLSVADLSDASLIGANLSGADLKDAHLVGTSLFNAHLPGANLTDADLRGADLRSADFRGADLTAANLSFAHVADGAHLSGAILTRADLHGADFRGADLSASDLSDANLTNARLADANLTDTDLTDTDLTDT
jgi:uncharacterized protein YjbI with pentapeptide repeats